MTHRPRHILVTGGAGFIGSAFVRRVLDHQPEVRITVLDKLTYAGNLRNLEPVADDPRYRFVLGDIDDAPLVATLVGESDTVVNFAAESHVDRSIDAAGAFVQTDVHGTFTLLEAVRGSGGTRFVQISTDEVYGDVPEGSSREDDPVRPRSPYSASKAAGDLLVLSYHATYGLPAMITRASNNFGPYQYPEKIVPLFITNALDGEPLPLYGDGQQIRDWLYVDDHSDAIELVVAEGVPGEIYNIGGGNELTNVELTGRILELTGRDRSLVRQVADRAGHDRRYSIDASKIRALGWAPAHRFPVALRQTVEWYREREDWWRPLKSGEYLEYYRRQYGERLAGGRSFD